MNRTVLALVLLAALALAGTLVLLSGAHGEDGASDLARSRRDAAQGLPSFTTAEPQDELGEPADLPHRTGTEAEAGRDSPAAGGPVAAAAPGVPTRRVAGRILRASDGSPLAGIEIRSEPFGETPAPPAALSAEDGSFALPAVPTSVSELTLAVTGAAPRMARVPIPSGPEPLEGLELVFDSGFRVAGRVLDAAGHPLPGARLDVGRRAEALAGPDGRFLVLDVRAEAGEGALTVRAFAPWHAEGRADILVPRSPQAVPQVELRLTGSGRIAGRVTRPDGSPAVNAQVECRFRMGDAGDSQVLRGPGTSTDGEGRYELDHVPAGRYVIAAAQPESDLPLVRPVEIREPAVLAWIPGVEVAEGRSTPLDIALPAPAAIAGRVLDGSGRPVAGARLTLERLLHWPAPGFQGHSVTISEGVHLETASGPDGVALTSARSQEAERLTGHDGLYAFEGLAQGARRLHVRDAGDQLAPQSRELDLRAGERLDPLDFVLATGLVLRAQVVDPAGRPLEGAQVYLAEAATHAITGEDLRARSGADGWFEAGGLAPGRKLLSISLAGYGHLYEELDPAAAPARFVLAPAPKLRGRVLDALTGEPVAAYALRVEAGSSYMESDVQPRPDGVFEADVGAEDLCRVTIRPPGYVPLELADLRALPEGQPVPEYRVNRAP